MRSGISQQKLAEICQPYYKVLEALSDPAIMDQFFQDCQIPHEDQFCIRCRQLVHQNQDIKLIKKCPKCNHLYHGQCAKQKGKCCNQQFVRLTEIEKKLVEQLKEEYSEKCQEPTKV